MMAKMMCKSYFIISDNKMNKKLSKYTCPTLTNLNYKVNDADRLMVFYDKDDATHHTIFCGDDLSETHFAHPVDMSDIQKLTECFGLLCDFY